MSAMKALATAANWTPTAIGYTSANAVVVTDAPKGKYTRLTITRGDVSRIDVYDTLDAALAG